MSDTLKKDARLIKTATGQDAERVAYFYGKSREWLVKQSNGNYPNFWTVSKRWVRSFALTGWDKAELFFNDFDIFKRELWCEIKGIKFEFPILTAEQKELMEIRNRLGLLLPN